MRYGLAIDARRMTAWQLACFEALRGKAELAVIVEVGDANSASPVMASGATSQRIVPLPPEIANHWTIVRIGSPVGREAAMHVLRDANLDFVLQLSGDGTWDDFLDVPRYGIWYFHHGDGTRFTSAAPYFWEVLDDHDASCAMLLKRCAAGAGLGTVLRSGYFATARTSYEGNADRCSFNAAAWPADVCNDISRGVASYFDGSPIGYPSRIYNVPNAYHRLKLRLVTILRRMSAFFRAFSRPYWNIGVIPNHVANLPDTPPGIRLLRPHVPGEYLGDPFVFQKDGKAHVFCEQFFYAGNRGNIAVFDLNGDGGSAPVTAIDEPFHMSYPQVFELEGEIYCLPESSAANEVRIYRAQAFPYTWALRARILCGFPAVDPTLLRYESRWWLFCTRLGEHQASHLYVWHAPALFGPWEQHPRNPVKIDVRSVRGAGPFFEHGGSVYRPAQDCSRRYGGRLAINRIVRLSPTEFEEVVDRFVEPPPHSLYSIGMHTIAGYGESSVVDVRRDLFSWTAVKNYLKYGARDRAKRLGFSDAQIERLKVQFRQLR